MYYKSRDTLLVVIVAVPGTCTADRGGVVVQDAVPVDGVSGVVGPILDVHQVHSDDVARGMARLVRRVRMASGIVIVEIF